MDENTDITRLQLREGIEWHASDNAVVFVGQCTPKIVRGSSAGVLRSFLSSLPLERAAAAGLSEAATQKVSESLTKQGFLTKTSEGDPGWHVKICEDAPLDVSPRDAWILVRGTAWLARLTAQVLERCGLAVEIGAEPPAVDSDVDDGELFPEHASVSQALGAHAPTIRLTLDDGRIVLSPVLNLPGGPCVECWDHWLGRLPDTEVGDSSGASVKDEWFRELAASALAARVVEWIIAGQEPAALLINGYPLSTAGGLTFADRSCCSCNSDPVPLSSEAQQVLLLHDHVAYRNDAVPPALPTLLTPAAATLQQSTRGLDSRRRIRLNDETSGWPCDSNDSVDRNLGAEANVTAFLVSALGLRSPPGAPLQDGRLVDRWCPSAGNGGSPEAYVAFREGHQLSRRFWFFDPIDCSLRQVVPPSRYEPLRRAAGFSGLASCLEVIVVCSWSRLVPKYGSLARRLAFLDAGFLAAHASICAELVGMNNLVSSVSDPASTLRLLDIPEDDGRVGFTCRIE